MTTLHTLASGSSGNALLLSCGSTHLLVDAGISCRRITKSLEELGLTPADLTAILITHTHADHISGLQTLLKRTDCPVCATSRTLHDLAQRLPTLAQRSLVLAGPESLGEVLVTAFSTSHDAPGSCGFRLDDTSGSVGILTDTGYVTDEAAAVLPGVDLAVLEANHDVETLYSGPYPYYLKQRILGAEGHLSNEDAARFAVFLAQQGTSEILLAHLSRTLPGTVGCPPGHHERAPSCTQEGCMQKVTLICVGKLKEKFYAQATAEYAKRLSRFCKLEIVELPESRLSDSPSPAEISQALTAEAALIETKLPKGSALVAMCIEGEELSSPQLAEKMRQFAVSGVSNLTFLIGGSVGLSPVIKAQADFRLSMSPMTFPHHLARVMLLEQIYRAYQINAGTKYHK